MTMDYKKCGRCNKSSPIIHYYNSSGILVKNCRTCRLYRRNYYFKTKKTKNEVEN